MSKKNMTTVQAEAAVTIDDRAEKLASVVQNGTATVTGEVNGETITVNVTKRLSLFDRSRMVEEIADYCFVGGFYAPYMLGFAQDIEMLNFYTDLPVGEMGSEDAYRLTQNADFMWDVRDAIEDDLDMIFDDSIKLVEWRKSQLNRSVKADELYDAAKNFISGLESLLDGVAKNMGDTSSLPGIFDAIQKIAGKDEAALAKGVLDFQEAKAKQDKKPVRKTIK